jgi:aspartate/methionine/tyrosine aminotransferase
MLTRERLNPHLLEAEYAVRGPIVIRAQQLEEQGRKIIYCNIGNPQALKQRPLTFLRQFLSLVEYPELLDRPEVLKSYPQDIVDRARMFLRRHPPGTGAYTQSPGIQFVRQAVADFISRRDGVPARKESIILTDGASKGAQAVIMAMLRNTTDGFLAPVPQYPLYSATIKLYGGSLLGYQLDEDNGWQLNESRLEDAVTRGKAAGISPVLIVVINPGNPTGAVLSVENIKMVVRFAKRHGLAIVADEVYQENVYTREARFHSFARIMHDMGEYDVSLFTLHSVSKGFLGECGHRGGYLEIRNVPDNVLAEFIKQQSISLCANVTGQIATYLMVAPPQPGDPSHALYVQERDAVLASLKAKADILGRGINRIAGMSLVEPHGAMYAFVRFELPPEPGVDVDAMTARERLEYESGRDSEYCMRLLEETGICVVPGSGFGQRPGTFHFRTTFLPPKEEIEGLVESLKSFHEKYTHELAAT